MSTVSVPRTLGARTVLADQLIGRRTLLTNLALIGAGAALVALLAQVEIPMWPVPITGQTLGVMLVGATLGAWRGAAALTTYLVAGLAGLPVFAGFTGGIASVGKPSFGFIIGFIFAAFVVGWLAERNWDRRPLTSLLAFLGASIIPFLFGVPYMWLMLEQLGTSMNFGLAMEYGVTPFILGGIVKWLLAAAALPLAWKGVKALERRNEQ
ncbi:biotin transporter BioY [Gulosibacter macacae]|uniref:Biotin transporter n=1 Tax=Gulosibacter macacae TaxID=2488791 RepID=A0A3P3VYS2_9MICO|nr:biotin transporter BioY [Gulosibacter macacae]RRJ87218.1 biotin transporter BioY [Gulosibacter macacae]